MQVRAFGITLTVEVEVRPLDETLRLLGTAAFVSPLRMVMTRGSATPTPLCLRCFFQSAPNTNPRTATRAKVA